MTDEIESLLLTRIVDRTASHEDWVEFEGIAGRDPTAWDRLHESMQDDLLLRRSLEPTFSLADAIDLPLREVEGAPALGRLLAPAGWLAALVLALLWIGTSGLISPRDPELRVRDPIDGDVRVVKDQDRVLEELPPDVLELRQRDDGRLEMVYLRQTVEHAVVDTLFRFAEDELGNARVMPVSTNKLKPPRVF
jgi:hypothetical protein